MPDFVIIYKYDNGIYGKIETIRQWRTDLRPEREEEKPENPILVGVGKLFCYLSEALNIDVDLPIVSSLISKNIIFARTCPPISSYVHCVRRDATDDNSINVQ